MRFLKSIFLIVFFVVAMLFFFQNTAELNKTVSIVLDFFLVKYQTLPIPMYALVLASFGVGGIVTVLFFLIDKVRLSSELKACRRRMAALEQEVNSLRNLPLDGQSYSTGSADAGSASSSS